MNIRSALLAASFLAVAQPALAQEELGEDTILVTTIRQAYSGDFAEREVPRSIAVIEAATLQDNNITRLTDALDLTASVSRQNNFGGLWDAFAVRGFSGDENLPSGYLVNGFNGGRGFGGPRDVSGIERIEVLKGPNAALFGRGEPGGTVNIVTKRALFGETAGEFSASYGSFDSFRTDGDLNLALGQAFAVRVTGFYENAESFRETIESERWGMTPSVGVRLGEDTTLTYELELIRQDVPFDRGIVAPGGQLDLIARNTFLGEPGDGPIEADATGHQVQLQHEFSADWSLLVGGSYRETSLEGFSTEPELAGSRQKLFVDGRSLSRQRRYRSYEAEHYVVRAELAGDFELGSMRHRLLVGGDFDRFEHSQLFLRFRPPAVSGNPSDAAANVIDILNPVYGRFPSPTPGPQTNRLDTQEAVGFYVQDQISLSDTVQIRLGARYDDVTVTSLNRTSGALQTRSSSRINPQAGIVWEAAPALSLYAAYGEGFRSNLGADAAGQLFDPEISRSMEVGAKFDLADRLTGTVALFDLTKSNVLASDPANPGFALPIGKAGSRGFEVDVNGEIGGVEVLLSYAYVDAEARADVLDPNFSLQINRGDRLINIPRHSLNLQLAREFMLGDSTLRLGSGVQHVGKRLGETATTFDLPAYTLVRAFASWQPSENLELFGEVRNLFNEEWYANSFASLWVQPGAPRTASIGIRAGF
ncbi:TonB-dependent siderophore receptor [Altererythrobacter sp. KTW20L]|uniref:TonB-dependent siderophore receptor n=1 Tax=Altererythrobacter sp. KTW20L TaxID=2942210 RepID=UPI0020BF597F|nr:TonB-dependent siderophore receptor [Altererythrobacter sp. KTW20L]MCL6250579.1 TonB-dependent siderophore receptor [Altererythrobacter sp. KTW20L]